MIAVTQMKASNANDQALDGANQQRDLLKAQKTREDKVDGPVEDGVRQARGAGDGVWIGLQMRAHSV